MAISADTVRAIVADMRMPAMGIYGGDWMRDAVAACSLGAQGLWFRMMLAMHDAKPYGHLVGSNGLPLNEKAIGRACGATTVGEFRRFLAELDEVGVPGRTGDHSYAAIFQGEVNGEAIDFSPLRIDTDGVLYCRRMIRDQRLRVIRKLVGKRGGNRILVNQPSDLLVNQLPDAYAGARAETDNDTSSQEISTKKPEGVQGEDPPGRKLTPQQEAVRIVLEAFSDELRPHPGLVGRWISQLAEGRNDPDPIRAAEAVREIVWKNPSKPPDYIAKCVGTAALKARTEPKGTHADSSNRNSDTTRGLGRFSTRKPNVRTGTD